MGVTNGATNGTAHQGKGALRPLPPDVARRIGRVAEEAQLRARAELARVLGDKKDERAAARKLAETLAARDVELDTAVELAFKTLASHDDPELRHQLAGWLEVLGEPALAASELNKIVAQQGDGSVAGLLVRIGVLHARAGDAVGAQEAFAEAAQLDQADALPLELLGAVAAWSKAHCEQPGRPEGGEGITPREGAEAYVRAARRRVAAGDPDAEIEDMLRAFELDPSSALAAAALMGAYSVRGNAQAADEVLRAHAAALEAAGQDAEAADVHGRRRESAIEAGQLARAFAAALDERLDAAFDGASADAFDDLLARASAFEPLAVRLEVRAERATGRAAAQRWADLGRLLSGPLAEPSRAIEPYARAVAADPTNTDALHALRALAQKDGDDAWLVEGLVRGALAEGEPATRLAALRALATYAEENRDEPLAAWAHAAAAKLDPSDERARSAASRLESALRRHREEIDLARRSLETSAEGGRSQLLEELARLLRSAPEAAAQHADVLVELALAKKSADDDACFFDAVRAAERVGDYATVEKVARARLDARGANVRVRNVLVSALRRKGDLAGALEATRAFADDAATRWTCSVAWTAAALTGDRATRGKALAAAAPTCNATVIATVAAAGAEELARAGDVAAARRAAEQACRHDGRHVRALRVLAELASPAEGRVAAAAIERAIEVAGPSSALARRLADALEHIGDQTQAINWARRAVALRPGDPEAMQALVDRAIRIENTEALADALAWIVPQPQPSKETADRIGPAIAALAKSEARRAAFVARRALDLLGPRHGALRTAIEQAADAADDAALRAKVAERWIAAGAPAAERGPLLFTLAAYYAKTDDIERELRAYARASRAGIDLSPVAARIAALEGVQKSEDAELAWLEVRAEVDVHEGKMDAAAAAFRSLGAAYWDLADDRPRAVQAWLRAAHCDSVNGYATLRRDLATFADPQYAVDCLVELVERESDRVRSGVIATQAARAALDVGAYSRALSLAKTALDRDPARAEALETAEQACKFIARIPDMSGVYDQVARRSLGRFGRRAAHHRAARFFEASGIAMLALKHAAQAFIAVPSEGTTLGLLQRTAEKANRQSIAVRTVEHVAELARGTHVRAAWLLRAATMTARDLEGTRQRVDLLLKAAVLVPSPVTLGMLSVAARELVSLAPDDVEATRVRLERASDSLKKSLEGPDGARIAITFVEMAMDLSGDGAWGWRSLQNAIGADADVDEYVKLLPHATALARAEGAQENLDELFTEIEKPYSNVGHALLRLAGAIAHGLGDSAKRARALVRAAEKESDDDEIVVEADAALAAHVDQAFIERFARRVSLFRRTEALRAIAKKHAEKGGYETAVALLERAHELAADEVKPEVAKELSEALIGAGRGEDAVMRDLSRADLQKAERAAKYEELARIRAERNDTAGAAEALFMAATDAPSAERWAAVEKVAERANRESMRVRAVEELVQLASGDDKVAAMKRLARAEAARGKLKEAEAAWREVWKNAPRDAEADVAIEALLVAQTRYDELAQHLAARATRLVGDEARRESLRAVRLRRAAILEQRLGRLEDACAELEQVLRETPNHPSALRWLADLYERLGDAGKALPVLEKLFAAANDEVEFVGIGVRRARAFLAAGDLAKAQQAVRELREKTPYAIAVAEARVDLARATHDPAELGDALADLARVSVEEPRVRSEMLVEAAQSAARAGNAEVSLARARDASRLAPDIASTQLFARGLEYRLRGAGNIDEAAETIAHLAFLSDEGLEPEDLALRAFLLAEAEDVVRGPGAGERTLRECNERVGTQPLVALGLAERSASVGRHAEAYRFYVEAVYGNLLGLRRPGRVALAAADCAERANDQDTVMRFLNEASKDPETRIEALRRLAQISVVNKDLARARNVLRGLAESSRGKDKTDALVQLARALLASDNPSHRLEGDRTMREAIATAPPDLARALEKELDSYRDRPPGASMPPPASTQVTGANPPSVASPEKNTPSTPPDRMPANIAVVPKLPPPPVLVETPTAEQALVSVKHPPLGVPAIPEEEVTPAPPSEKKKSIPAPPESAAARLASEPTHRVAEAVRKIEQGERDEGEKILADALRAGSIDAADALDAILAPDPGRRAALIKVRRQAVELLPGDVKRLAALRDAARQDQNLNYMRAIEHVLRAFDTQEGAVTPPPLSAQDPQPGMLELLTKHSREPAGEAFAAVWEGAQSLFAKQPAAYGMSGLERVVPGPANALTKLYEVALRLLESPRFALFHKKDKTAPALKVALLAQPSAIIMGDAKEDTNELRWVLGQALACVLPQNTLCLGLSPEDAQALWQVLLVAFGPPAPVQLDRANARLAETLWQTLAPRSQRRLKDVLADSRAATWEVVAERARQSGRRIGMFLTGDFGHAARAVVRESGGDVGELERPGGLAKLCMKLPSLADLFRLAVRPEYADARWHVPTPASMRLASGRTTKV